MYCCQLFAEQSDVGIRQFKQGEFVLASGTNVRFRLHTNAAYQWHVLGWLAAYQWHCPWRAAFLGALSGGPHRSSSHIGS